MVVTGEIPVARNALARRIAAQRTLAPRPIALVHVNPLNMPLPSPKSTQSEQSFVSSCMSDKAMNKEYPNQKQRAAVCYSQYKQAKRSKSSENVEWADVSAEEYIILL